MAQPLSSPSPRSSAPLAWALAWALLASPTFAAEDGVDVQLGVFFCDGDLVCDPEEDEASCPGDCSGAPAPDPEPDDEDEGRRRSASGRGGGGGGGGGATTTVAPPPATLTTVTTAAVSSKPVDPTTERLAETIDVATGGADEAVRFTWEGTGRAEIRVLRADGPSFPTSPFDGGIVVYEGRGGGFVDEISPGQTARYAAFVKQPDGTYGARLLVVVSKVSDAPDAPPEAAQSLTQTALEAVASPWAWISILLGVLLGLFVRVPRKM